MEISSWWVDALLVSIAVLYSIDGVRRGFFLVLTEVVGFFLSLIAAFIFYPFGAKALLWLWNIPHSFANAIAFFVVWIVAGLVYPLGAKKIYARIPQHLITHKANHVFGFVPALLDALVLAAVILPLIVALPLSAPIKQAVLRSAIGAPIARGSQQLDNRIEGIFEPVIRDGLAFMTVHPKSDETVPLRFRTMDHSVDEESETEMFRLVNEERLSRNLPALTFDSKLRALSRTYAEAMLEQGYFSHIGSDGSTPGVRATRFQVTYTLLGENLAFAPDVVYAHDGLMHSPGHRANILSADFGTLGIGVIDAGLYGKMFVQTFTD